MLLVLWPILLHDIACPRPVAELILGVIAVTVFAFSKYRERRNNPN